MAYRRPEPKTFLALASQALRPEEYRASLFGETSSRELLGEKSTSYADRADSLRRIDTSFPEAPILCFVRDPIARALSNLYFSIDNGLEKEAPETALLRELNCDLPPCPPGVSASPHAYLSRSRYERYLPPARAIFGSRLLVLQSEQLDRRATVNRMLTHLGLPSRALDIDYRAEVQRADALQLSTTVRERLARYFEPTLHGLNEMAWIDIDFSLWPTARIL